MKCNESQNFMMKFFDKNINDIEEAQLKQHLKSCTACSEEFQSLKQIFSEIEQEPATEPPEDFELQVMSRIEKEAVLYSKPETVAEIKSDMNVLLITATLITVALFAGFLFEVIKNPVELIKNINVGIVLVKEFLTAGVSMVKGVGMAIISVTASLYKNYYYAYIALAALLLLTQRTFFKMVREGNGEAQ